ncbi:MAG: glutathione S-transferase family protein [Alphaproteobacteria bacterium]|nr:glutathione S-transferase family protein [Alphaproteobacteria bacterium]
MPGLGVRPGHQRQAGIWGAAGFRSWIEECAEGRAQTPGPPGFQAARITGFRRCFIRATIIQSALTTCRRQTPMDIALYYAPITCALAPYITLTEAGAKFEVRPLNFRKNQHNSPEYLKINPKHKVPLLIVDGKILSESIAIQTFIARTFPQAKLLPSDPWQELQAMSIMSWCSGGIHPFLARTNSPQRVCDVPGTEDSVKKIAAANLMELFKIADDMLAGREFFFDHFTAPDAHFFWCQRRARQFELDLSGFKNIGAHFDRMLSRPSVQKVYAFEKSVQEEFANAA